MKRKSGRKSSKKEEENSNGVENKSEQNGDASDRDEDEPPKDKKRRSSKPRRKNVSFSSKKEEAASESDKSEDEDPRDDYKEDKKSSKASRKSKRNEEESPSEDEGEDANEKKRSSKKASPKAALKDEPKEKKEASDEEDEDDESQYEVESVLDEKMIKGVRHYLIRWKGYEEESDTWEPEGTLDCDRLIQEFKEKKKKGIKPKKVHKKEKKEGSKEDWDENQDFEVDRILEVHHKKDGKREFLVSWKGYTSADNTWEPEENMDCKDLIEKFMAKVERAKQVDERELRVHRPHVQRYTLNTLETGRRLSKRFKGKERVQYHDAE